MYGWISPNLTVAMLFLRVYQNRGSDEDLRAVASRTLRVSMYGIGGFHLGGMSDVVGVLSQNSYDADFNCFI